ncbi:ABC transporter, ATP-binding protein [Lacticaseibacillus rhamnosus ATCC 21052]|nr:ABC transporter, ATP-binding protein [Lacticaseibacillus rhamnosus ATCC 21052]
MAKSREKQLARMDKLTPPGTRAKAHLAFPYMPVNRQMLVDVNDLVVGYDKPLLQPINFSVAKDQVIAFEGFNGVGKSTLLKTILGLLPALGGSVEIADNVTFGYYEQELHWDQPKQSPVQYLQQRFPALTQKTVRQVLSRTALTSEEANNPLTMLSGGEQAKVKLADLMLQTTNILVMDEPTNHLDDDTKNALRSGLQQYPGAVLLVSHEAGFYDQSWVDTVVNVEQLQVKE